MGIESTQNVLTTHTSKTGSIPLCSQEFRAALAEVIMPLILPEKVLAAPGSLNTLSYPASDQSEPGPSLLVREARYGLFSGQIRLWPHGNRTQV